MILVVDSSTLVLLVNPASNPPDDPATGAPVVEAAARVQHLIKTLRPNDTLIVPTPVLAEMMVKAGDGGPGVLETITGLARVRIAEFGVRAAVELAAMTREAIAAGGKKAGSEKTWQAVKFDRQIVATAIVERADRIYSDDEELVAFARRAGVEAISTWELPLPEREIDLFTSAGIAADGTPPEMQLGTERPSLPVSASIVLLTGGPRAIKLDEDAEGN